MGRLRSATKDVKSTALPAMFEQPDKFKEAASRLENETAQALRSEPHRRRGCGENADRRGRQGLRRLPRELPPEAVAIEAHARAPPWRGFFFCARLRARSAQGDAKRGEYLAKAAGCVGCHTEERKDAEPYAGGRALKTPFGTFYGPNITPHPQAGIGRWSDSRLRAGDARGPASRRRELLSGFPLSVVHAHQRCATCATCGRTCAR